MKINSYLSKVSYMGIYKLHAMRIQYLFHKKQVAIFIEELVKPGYQKNEE